METEWQPLRLGGVCQKIGSGATPRGGGKVYLTSGGVAFIRSQNIYNEGFHREGLVYLTAQHADELSNVAIQPGDVLLNITGDSVARCCQVDSGILPARVNQHVAIIRPDPRRLDPRFLRYSLITASKQSELLALAGSGATRNALTKGMIDSLSISAPADVAEQRAIAHILGTLDDKIELNRQMSATLEAMARALFESWFVRFDPVRAKAEGRDTGLPADIAALFPDSFEQSEIGEVPKGWSTSTVDTLATLNPHTWSISDAPSHVRYVDLSSAKNGRISDIVAYSWDSAPSRARRALKEGDTIFGTVRPGNKSYALIAQSGLTGSTGFAVLRPRSRSDSALVYLAITNPPNVDRLNALADGGAYPAVSPELVAKTPLALPARRVLDTFSDLSTPLVAAIGTLTAEAETLASVRDTLLPKLISGELRVPDAERALATAGVS